MEPGYDLRTPLARAETPLNNSDALEELRGRLRERFGPTIVDLDGCRPPNAAAGVRVSIRLIPGRPAQLEESYAGQIDDVVNPVIRVRTRVPLTVLKDEKELQRVLDLVGRRVVTMSSSHAGAYKGALAVLSHDSDIFELSDDDFEGLRAWAALAFLAASAVRGSSLETFFEVCGHAMQSLGRRFSRAARSRRVPKGYARLIDEAEMIPSQVVNGVQVAIGAIALAQAGVK